ncbi:hypothetical protein [Kordiimonas pumila]|uniref:Uncharacterized protein n=1 Tax=Kordiimonas pumila TaxID=2161677 RepID=A0ABV7D9F6_9PROT|nr:hypothetical protein [Kordiimonas pumila]
MVAEKMMKRFWGAQLAILVGVLAGTPLAAEQYWAADVHITGVAVVSNDHTYPAFNNVIWVGVDKTDWLPESCRSGAAGGLVFPSSNSALYDIVMRAAEQKWSVTMKVDDTSRIGDLCELFQVTVHF